MQKKIIALAIAAALTAPALAFADATVYGVADLSVDMENDGAPTNGITNNKLVSNASRVGVKGSEDLGGGMAVVYQMESTVGMDTGNAGTSTTAVPAGFVAPGTLSTTNQLFDRDTFLGLASGVGTGIVGRHDTPYKMATRKLDLFADSAADNRKLMGNGVQDARLSNVIAYVSPNLGGLTIIGATVFGAETAVGAVPAQKKGTALSLAGMYSQGPIFASLAYQTVKLGTTGTGDLGAGNWDAAFGAPAGTLAADDKTTAIKAGFGFSMEMFAANVVVEKLSANVLAASTSSITNTNFYLAGKFNITSADAVKLAYIKQGDQSVGGVSSKTGATQIAVGYDHEMSKNTGVYALYTKVTPTATNSATPSVISVGMKHSF